MVCSICYNTYMIKFNFASDIRLIRTCLDMSQSDFADAVLLSRSNIARYEAGKIIPRKDALERIYNYSFLHQFDINQAKTMIYEDKKGSCLVLYHGAKKEIEGEVDTKHSAPPNDFGNAFYLGQTLKQANMWVAPYKEASTYCFYFKDREKLKHMSFEVDYNWMMAILYYRGYLNDYELPDNIKRLIDQIEESDYIIAPIADNQMYDTIEAFKNNLISDVACLHALSANNLGFQYVLKSERACKCLKAIDCLYLCSEEKDYYLSLKEKTASDGRNKIALAIAKYRKEGKLFNELFKRKG